MFQNTYIPTYLLNTGKLYVTTIFYYYNQLYKKWAKNDFPSFSQPQNLPPSICNMWWHDIIMSNCLTIEQFMQLFAVMKCLPITALRIDSLRVHILKVHFFHNSLLVALFLEVYFPAASWDPAIETLRTNASSCFHVSLLYSQSLPF